MKAGGVSQKRVFTLVKQNMTEHFSYDATGIAFSIASMKISFKLSEYFKTIF